MVSIPNEQSHKSCNTQRKQKKQRPELRNTVRRKTKCSGRCQRSGYCVIILKQIKYREKEKAHELET